MHEPINLITRKLIANGSRLDLHVDVALEGGSVGNGQPRCFHVPDQPASGLEVDAFRGKTFTGRIRYVSPVLRTDTRALVVEAVVPNDSGQLKPGLFATAKIEQASETRAVLVPAAAITNVTGAARVYLIKGDHTAEERLVTTGQMVDELIEITSGLQAGDTVATSNLAQLTDGALVAGRK